jgi:hypothetical protein
MAREDVHTVRLFKTTLWLQEKFRIPHPQCGRLSDEVINLSLHIRSVGHKYGDPDTRLDLFEAVYHNAVPNGTDAVVLRMLEVQFCKAR